MVQGGSLPAVARLLRIATPVTPRDIDVESAPLDELGAELMQLTVPPGSRLHGVYLPELRLPRGRRRRPRGARRQAVRARPGTRLMRGDQALLVSARGSRAEAERRLRAVSRAGRLATWRGETGRPTEVD